MSHIAAPQPVYDRSLLPEDRQRIVTGLVATASIMSNAAPKPGQPNYYHWRIYMQLQPSMETQGPHLAAQNRVSKAVLFDMTPSADFPVGILMVQSKSYERSTAREKVEYIVPLSQHHTIQQYIDLFIANGVQRYCYDSTGNGCMYWVASVIRLLEQRGWTAPGHYQGVLGFHEQHGTARPLNFALPLREGKFY